MFGNRVKWNKYFRDVGATIFKSMMFVRSRPQVLAVIVMIDLVFLFLWGIFRGYFLAAIQSNIGAITGRLSEMQSNLAIAVAKGSTLFSFMRADDLIPGYVRTIIIAALLSVLFYYVLYVFLQGITWALAADVRIRDYLKRFAKINIPIFLAYFLVDGFFRINKLLRTLSGTTGEGLAGESVYITAFAVYVIVLAYVGVAAYTVGLKRAGTPEYAILMITIVSGFLIIHMLMSIISSGIGLWIVGLTVLMPYIGFAKILLCRLSDDVGDSLEKNN